MSFSRDGGQRLASTEGSDWFTATRFGIFLALIILTSFPSVLVGLESFVYRDFAAFGYPLAFYHREAFWRGELPLWNPFNHCGIPFLAQWNTLTLYPPSLIYLMLPLPWSLNFFCLAHLFLGGLGMYFLAEHWVSNRLAASVAGVAFALSGLTLNSLMWPNNIAALGWMPWVVLNARRGWSEGGRQVVIASLIGVLQMLAGAPEVILLTWVFITVFWIDELCSANAPKKSVFLRHLTVVFAVGGLAAVQLLPFLELLQKSQRGLNFAEEFGWAMPPWGWANLLVPLFRCYRTDLGVFLQYDQKWTSSYYSGAGVLALSLLAAWTIRRRQVWILTMLVFVSLVLALGDAGYLYSWLRKLIPGLGLLRYPIKFVVLTNFLFPLLAASALASADFKGGMSSAKVAPRLIAIGLAFACLMSLTVWWSYHRPLGEEKWQFTLQNAAVRFFFLGLILTALFFYGRAKRGSTQALVGIFVLLLIAGDALTHIPWQNPTVPAAAFRPDLVKLEPPLRLGESRALMSRATYSLLSRNIGEDHFNNFVYHRLGLAPNGNLLDHVPTVDGFYSLTIREQQEVWALLFSPATNTLPSGLKDLFAASHYTSQTNSLFYEARPNSPPVVSAGQQPIFADQSATLAELASPDFDSRRTILLPLEAKPHITVTNRTQAAVIANSFSAQCVEITVQASEPSLVFIAQTFYDPWKAYVDSKRMPLWRANHAFQCLEIPAGRHIVRLVYEDRQFYLGAAISILTLLCCGAWLWFGNRATQRTPNANLAATSQRFYGD